MKRLLMIFPLALILCFMVGCQDKKAMAELEEFKAQAAMEEQNKELIRSYLKAMDNKNFEIVTEAYAPDAKIYYPSNNPEPASVEQSITGAKSFFEAFPDFNHNIEELIAVGDKVILRAVDRGTHQEEFNGIPATGMKIELGVLAIFQIKERKIVEIREEFDMLGMLTQLGMELKQKEREE